PSGHDDPVDPVKDGLDDKPVDDTPVDGKPVDADPACKSCAGGGGGSGSDGGASSGAGGGGLTKAPDSPDLVEIVP
ncbi:MAG: hypothetical protein NZL88_10320, partial [Gaiellaceae bacterium]|nr:hypothetical protein [Gaiellaceae bacterium]